MREYRRDVGRYLNGMQQQYPEIPQSYFDDATVIRMENFRMKAESNRDGRLVEDFPVATLRAGLEGSLSNSAAVIFGGWVNSVLAQRVVG